MSDSNAFARVVQVLPAGETAASYAARCSAAVASFLDGARTWGKRELAGWLVEAYRPAVFDLEPARRNDGVVPLTASKRLTRRPVSDASVRAMLQQTCEEIETMLVAPEILVSEARSHLDVVASIDAFGDEVYLAISRPKMRLSRRVASLVAVEGIAVEAPRSSGAFLVKSAGGVVRATRYAWVSGDR